MFKEWLLPYIILNMMAILVSRIHCILSCAGLPFLYVEVQYSRRKYVTLNTAGLTHFLNTWRI